MAEDIEIHEADEWSAVYLNGRRVHGPADSYLSDEWLRDHFGVVTVQDDAFMRGQTSADGAAKTLVEVDTYRDERDARLRRAAELRAEADRLAAEAENLAAMKGNR
jgi:hypothetical protein